MWNGKILLAGLCFSAMTSLALAQSAPEFPVGATLDEQAGEKVDFADLLAVMHGVAMVGSIHRGSEMGHENFRSELDGEPMKAYGEHWLRLVSDALEFVRDDGGFAQSRQYQDGAWLAEPAAEPGTLALAAYSYHMHHRGSRWADLGLQDQINFQPLPLVTQPGRYVLEQYYGDGRFHRSADQDDWDRTSHSQGLSALHSTVYAWVRWQKPEGQADMGQIPEQQLRAHLGLGRDELVTIAQDSIAFLDEHWDDSAGGYDFGEGTETSIEDLGALLRGHKALYETLYMFSDDDDDHQRARDLFERTADLVDAVAAIRTPAGLPAKLRFRDGQAEALTDQVDLAAQWRYVMELGAGYGFTREREGSAEFLQNHRPETLEGFGTMVDELLGATESYAYIDGRMVSALSWDQDDDAVKVADASQSVQAVGLYLTAASNVYRSGEAYERAQDWDDADEDVVERSQALYERFLDLGEQLKRAGIRGG